VSLQDWLNNRWLEKHQTTPQEINDLLAIVDRDLKDCQISELSPDWKMNIAYNAGAELVTLFDQFRKKRNISGYDCAGMISDLEANEMRNLAIHLREKVIKWLQENHPDLI